MEFTKKKLTSFCTEKILIKAEALFNSERIDFLEVLDEDEGIINYNVSENDDEYNNVFLNYKDFSKSLCDCDYSVKGKFCKHIIAAGLLAIDEKMMK